MARDRLQMSGVSYGDRSSPGNPYTPVGLQYDQQPSYGQQSFGQQDQYSNGAKSSGDFWGDMNNTNALLNELEQKISAVREAHQATLNSTDANTLKYADQLSDDARDCRERCKAAIKQLSRMATGNKQLKAQVETVNTRFRDLLQQHQNVEREYRAKTKDRAARQYKIVKPDASPEEIEHVMQEENPQVFAQALLNTNRYGAARGAYREVQERHLEIQKIEKSITELAQMFNEMSMLVEQQDEDIQQIHQQTVDVHHDIDKGNVQLDEAKRKALAARKKKWICFWIVVVILCIVAIVVAVVVTKVVNASKNK